MKLVTRLRSISGSLFVKTFLMFWITTITMIAATFLLTRPLSEDIIQRPAKQVDIEQVERLATRFERFAAKRIKRLKGEQPPIDDVVQKILDTYDGKPSILINLESSIIIEGATLPPIGNLDKLLQFNNVEEIQEIRMRGLRSVGPAIANIEGSSYAVFTVHPRPRGRWHGISSMPIWIRLGIPLVVSLLLCSAFAWNLTKPIRALRKASHQLGQGNFETRVDEGINRVDEIGSLSRDFNKMAEELSRLIGAQKRLLGNISHELRSPLARMQVAIGLSRKLETEDLKRYLDRIELESERMDKMIGDSLSLSRIENQLQQTNKEVLDLGQLVTSLCKDGSFEAKEQNKAVNSHIEDEIELSAEHDMLASAIENVLRNAIKYTHPDTAVDVTLQRENDTAILTIEDRGPGVPEELLSMLFIPFYRVSSSRQRQSGGTGLGLAIAERAIENHNGVIHASNRDGGGLTIKISLPISAD